MLCIALVSATIASQALVRKDRQQSVQEVSIDVSDLGEAAEPQGLVEQESQIIQWVTYCGKGDHAEYACVLKCLKDDECSRQAPILAALGQVSAYSVEAEGDGHVFSDGSICATPKKGMSFCKKGAHDANVCHRGECRAYDDNEVCDEDSNDQEKCKVTPKQKASAEELAAMCFGDSKCRQRLLAAGGEHFMTALGLTCVHSEESGFGKKRCYFSPEKPCVDRCRDGVSCQAGKCPEEEISLAWSVPDDAENPDKLTTGEKVLNGVKSAFGFGGKNGKNCNINDTDGICRKKDDCTNKLPKWHQKLDGCAWGYVCCGDN